MSMMQSAQFGDVSLSIDKNVALIEFSRPPHNFFDVELVTNLADALETVDGEPEARAVLLASEGKSFCAGADFSVRDTALEGGRGSTKNIYTHALRLFSTVKPIVCAVQGAAIGGGFGLALVADFRVVSTETRFSANFVKLNLHSGFGLSYLLPRLVGVQNAALMLYTGRRITGADAVSMGLADILAPAETLRNQAMRLAQDIAENAPLAVQALRATLRKDVLANVKAQIELEITKSAKLFDTADFHEGVEAVKERRPGRWTGS